MPAQGTLAQEAAVLAPTIVAWRRHLHRHPELSLAEHDTTEFIAGRLTEMGLVPVRPTSTGLWADIQGGHPGPTVLLRADIDALPVTERTDLDFRSAHEGVMHACGHDCHAAMLLGAARLLSDRRESLAGRVRLLFQPAEETAAGARLMMGAGVLEGVDHAFGLHVFPLDPASGEVFPAGRASVSPGARMAAADLFRIRISGRGGHGAAPHYAVDPVLTAAEVIVALQKVVARRTDPLAPAVLTVGAVHAGRAPNVIPPDAELVGTTRSFDEATRDTLEQEIRRIAHHVAASAGATAEVEYTRGTPPLVNATSEAQVLHRAAEAVLGEGQVVTTAPVMGSEDFAFILQERPGAFLFLGCGNDAEGAVYSNHHPSFAVDERALPQGAAVLAEVALDLLRRD